MREGGTRKKQRLALLLWFLVDLGFSLAPPHKIDRGKLQSTDEASFGACDDSAGVLCSERPTDQMTVCKYQWADFPAMILPVHNDS
jgi:hypothetical protein